MTSSFLICIVSRKPRLLAAVSEIVPRKKKGWKGYLVVAWVNVRWPDAPGTFLLGFREFYSQITSNTDLILWLWYFYIYSISISQCICMVTVFKCKGYLCYWYSVYLFNDKLKRWELLMHCCGNCMPKCVQILYKSWLEHCVQVFLSLFFSFFFFV